MGMPAASLPTQLQRATGELVAIPSLLAPTMVCLQLATAAVSRQSSAPWAPMLSQAVWRAGEKGARNKRHCCDLFLCWAGTLIHFLPVASLLSLNQWDERGRH